MSFFPRVAILMGSDSDLPTMEAAFKVLHELEVPCEMHVLSAHRTPADTIAYASELTTRGIRVVIAGAGGAAHLAGVVAAHTLLPVIGVPLASLMPGGMDALLSTVQMPPGVPVATVGVGSARNAGILAAQILALSDPPLATRLEAQRVAATEAVRQKDADLQERLASPARP
jgi:phosphoribosylaminoimidazole carboxylase PurE protein